MQLAAHPVPPALNAAAETARAFFTKIGVTEAEGNGPIRFDVDLAMHDARYAAEVSIKPDGSRELSDERVEIGSDPFTKKPFWTSPDVVYHELTHRLTEHIVPGFGTIPTSRVVDESLSDTFAAAIDGNWTMGEGILPGGLRSMSDPSSQQILIDGTRTTAATPATFGEMTAEVEGFDPYHNIGPLNNAAYRIGTKLGVETMARIYLQTMREHLQPSSGPTELVMGTIRSAGELFGASSEQQQAVRDAWIGVGVREAAVNGVR